MSIFKIGNINKVNKKLQQMITPKLVKSKIRESVQMVEKEVKQSLQRGGSGQTYQKYKPRRTHTASAAGQPPATDLGNLVRSISIEVKERPKMIEGRLIVGEDYAIHLEYGTTNMQARPFLQPAFEKSKPKIKAKFAKGVL